MLEGWKTIIFNSILVFVGVADQIGIIIPDGFADTLNGAVVAIIGFVGIVLRMITRTPVGGVK